MKFWVLLILMLPLIIVAKPVKAESGELIKGQTSAAVYYLFKGKRFAFPNEKIFYSWDLSFDNVNVITDLELAKISLAGLVTYRPGTRLVKVQSDPKVYAVEGRGLRWVKTEDVAREVFGSSWAKQIDDISDALFLNYFLGQDIDDVQDYHPAHTAQMYWSIDSILSAEVMTTCGNGSVENDEECDGGWYCGADCKISGSWYKYQTSYQGGFSVSDLKVGDKLEVGDRIYLRIESIAKDANPAWGSRIGYSVWGNNSELDCKLISASGEFWTNYPEKKYRAFSSAFVELLGNTTNTVTLKRYYGESAKYRCNQIAQSDKSYACNFYPDENSYYVQSENFRVNFTSSESALAAEYYARAFENCYQLYKEKIPGLYRVSPYGVKYNIYPTDDINRFESDFERISIPRIRFTGSIPIAVLKTVEGNRCPMEESLIAHELTHVLFANTVLQGLYDESTKAELNSNNYPGSVQLTEGLATYLPTYLFYKSDDDDAQNYEALYTSYCGKDRLIDQNGFFNGAKPEQMIYSNILTGDVYKGSDYNAGYCFFKRAELQCGITAISYLINKVLEYDGITESHDSVFKFLAEGCDRDTVLNLMNDFGFDQDLFYAKQKFPNRDFASGLFTDGCY
ncbi:MAG: hypothetical protein ACOYUZ_01295 [Patescibacteria group bacterium]